MINFLFTNSNADEKFNFKQNVGNYKLYSDKRLKPLYLNKFKNFLVGSVYDIVKLKSNILNDSNDGRYCQISQLNKSIKISVDQFSRADIYYSQEKNNFFISTNFNLIAKLIKSKSINQLAIGHALNVIGIRPAKKQTFFNEISRIGVNENLIIKKNRIFLVKKKFNPKSSEKFNDDKIKEYHNINQLYLKQLSKTSKKNIYMSSGFDSSYLAANQKSIFGNKNIMGHTVVQKISRRSKIYNIFELERIKKLKKHFNFKVKLVELDLVKNFEKYSEKISSVCSDRMMTNTIAAFMHHKLAQSCKKYSFSDEAYAGEVSDGAHNLGFSQFFSLINHESNGFREYSDKKLSYLYSPSFFKKIQKGNYSKDYIFKEIASQKYRKINSIKTKSLNSIFYQVCNYLFNTNSRMLFNEERNDIFKNNLYKEIEENLKKDYFSNVNIKRPDQLYASYIYLYNSFHWQASTICTMYNFADVNNIKMYLPYWNPKLHDYLSRMPEEWGRGLEMKNVKYPLKESFRRYLNYPKILEEGFHSYLYDVKKYSDPFLEIISNTSTRNYIKKIFKKYHPCDYLNSKLYNENFIYKLLRNYQNNKNFEKYSVQIFRIYNISKLFYDLDQN